MKVQALRTGYINHVRRREGEVFVLKPVKGKKYVDKTDKAGKPILDKKGNPLRHLVDHVFSTEEQFSDVWMVKVDPKTPVSRGVGAQAALDAETAAIKALKTPANVDDEAEVI